MTRFMQAQTGVWRRAIRRAVRLVLPLRRDERGITTAEFAILAPVFVYLVMGILELSMMFFTTIVVDGAVQDAGRRIRTGQAQDSGNTLSFFVNEVCSGVDGIYSCGDITFDVRTFSDFGSVSIPITVDEDGNYVTDFSAGGSGEITAVRALYGWDFTTPLLGEFFGTEGNRREMTMTTAFRNEAY